MAKEKIDYLKLLNSIENPIMAMQEDLKITYCNSAYARLINKQIIELEGHQLREVFPEIIGTSAHLAYLEVLEKGNGKVVEREIGNNCFSEQIYRTHEGIVSVIYNVNITKWQEKLNQAFTVGHRAVFDEINDAVVIFNLFDDKIVDINKAACNMFGYTREEMLQLKVGDLSAEELSYNKEDFIRCIKKPYELRSQHIEWKGRDRSGRVFWIEIKAKKIEFDNELRGAAVIQDITWNKDVKKEIRNIDESYRNLFETPGDFIFIHDLGGNFISVNQTAERITGYFTEELLEMNIQDLANNDSLKILRAFQYQRMTQNQLISYEVEIETKYYTQIVLHVKIWPIYKDGKAIAVQGIARDITEMKSKEIRLQDSAEISESFIEFLPDATMAIDMKGRVVIWNRAMEELTGIKAEDMLGKGDYEYGLAFYDKRRPIMVDLVLRPEEVKQYYSVMEIDKYTVICETNAPCLKGKGSYLWGQAMPWFDKNGNLIGAIESLRDITERYKTRQQLRESQEKINRDRKNLFDLIDNLDVPIISYDENKLITLTNRKFSQIVGYEVEELPGMNLSDIVLEADNGLFENNIMKGLNKRKEEFFEITLCNKDGSKQLVKAAANPLYREGNAAGCIMRIEIPGKQ